MSRMNLVDLAGSERASRTGAQGDTLKAQLGLSNPWSFEGRDEGRLAKGLLYM